MDSMRGKVRAIKKILLVFLIAVLLTGCGKKESVSLCGKAYNYNGDEHVTRSLVFAEQKCAALGMDILCVVLITENDEKLVFE